MFNEWKSNAIKVRKVRWMQPEFPDLNGEKFQLLLLVSISFPSVDGLYIFCQDPIICILLSKSSF